MTQVQQKKAAEDFIKFWKDKGDEKQHTQHFWTALLRDVLGVEHPEQMIDCEKRVKIHGTKFIDGYIADTRVAIEQKSMDVDLDKPEKQSDGTMCTPFEQAKRYNDNLTYSQRCRWIVVCNFKTFRIYDMEKPEPEKSFEAVNFDDLPNEFYRLQFLVDSKNMNIRREEEISLKAGDLVGKLYDALYKQYIDPDEKSLHSLNILCVRIVFCLYAEDAGLFDTRTSFDDYISSFSPENLRMGIKELFKALDTKPEDRDKYDTKIKPFPYVNGGLFKNEDIEIPNFTQEVIDVIIKYCAPFDWSQISPTIFGAVFESTLNPETRRKGGMHYTSIENIHKVIDPLFLDDLYKEFNDICAIKSLKSRNGALTNFQKKLGSLTFLDPACGSGNFLTETYLSLRRLENKAIRMIIGDANELNLDDSRIHVHINQFYGIEINDFAVTVAKTALWIAESQMMSETAQILGHNLEFLPLSTNASIVEGNALKMDWSTLQEESALRAIYAEKLNIYKADEIPPSVVKDTGIPDGGFYKELNVIAKDIEQKDLSDKKANKPIIYSYIIGNPPFIGARWMGKNQKEDVLRIFGKDWQGVGDLDYVCCWYKKAIDFIKNHYTRCAFVSTNSVTQGGSVTNLWKPLFASGIHIDFAWRTFRWDSESNEKAHVHCVIIGFSAAESKKLKLIFMDDHQIIEAKNINGYLLDAPNVFIDNRNTPICPVPEIKMGNQPIDNGLYLFSDVEKSNFIEKEPQSALYFRKWLGGDEFINGHQRWCLWLGDCSPAQLRKMPHCLERVQAVQKYRFSSKRVATLKLAQYPTHFQTENMPHTNYIVIPEVSSEKRNYIPIGFLSPEVLCSNKLRLLPDASKYHFGILTSNVHNIWIHAVCGRLKSDYDYSIKIVYNNFPWPNPSAEQKAKIEETAQAILDARAKYPDSSLADLYDDLTMPPDLRKSHQANDKAVMQAYGFDYNMGESEIVAELFKLYQELVK